MMPVRWKENSLSVSFEPTPLPEHFPLDRRFRLRQRHQNN